MENRKWSTDMRRRKFIFVLVLFQCQKSDCFISIQPINLGKVLSARSDAITLKSAQPKAVARADPADVADDSKGSTILLIRHGETEWNSLGQWQGQLDSPLTEQGVSQAVALGNRLRDSILNVDVVSPADIAKSHEYFMSFTLLQIYSSDLPRAKRTAEIIHDILTQHDPKSVESSIREISLLRERSFGIFEGKTRDQVMKEFPTQYFQFQKFDLVPVGPIPHAQSARP